MAYTLDTSRMSANRAIGRGGRRIRHITIHYWGTWVHQSHNGIVDYLSRKRTPGTSAHYVLSPGFVSRIVPEADTSWANGNRQANQESITIELCPDPARLEQTIATCAELVRDIRGRHGDLPLYPHKKWTSTDCPGPFTNRLGDIDRLARGAAPAPARPASPTTPTGVTQTQASLAALGFAPGPADGVLGPATKAATAAYQADRGLTADGVPGPTTRQHLEADMTTLNEIAQKLDSIPRQVWGVGGGAAAPMIPRGEGDGTEYPLTGLSEVPRRTARLIAPLAGQVAGLTAAIEQLAKGQGIDLGAITAAAEKGAKAGAASVSAEDVAAKLTVQAKP